MSTFDPCYSHQKRRWCCWLTGDVLVASLFARDFGQKMKFMVRHSKTIPFYDPKWARPKDFFLTRLHVAVFYESGTDRKRTVPPIDPCYSRQKRRRGDQLTGRHFLSALAANGIKRLQDALVCNRRPQRDISVVEGPEALNPGRSPASEGIVLGKMCQRRPALTVQYVSGVELCIDLSPTPGNTMGALTVFCFLVVPGSVTC